MNDYVTPGEQTVPMCILWGHIFKPNIGLFYLHGLTLIPPWIMNYPHYKIVMKSLASLKLGNGQGLSSHTLLRIYLLIQ